MLVINLGSTSTKAAVYENDATLCATSIPHSAEDVKKFKTIWEQKDYRREGIEKFLAENKVKLEDFDIFVTRGGNVRPTPGGIYIITPAIVEEITSGKYGTHPTGLGSVISLGFATQYDKQAIFMDAPVTDELGPLARLTGIPEILVQSSFHALNQKATARKIAADLGKTYAEARLIVCHLGGGISVGAHLGGRVVDVNNALDGDGPMSPERAGSVPTGSLVDMCYSGDHTLSEMRKKLTGKGGWVAHLGSSDGREVVKRMNEGDEKVRLVFDTTCYQTAKGIGAMAAVLEGRVDGIGLTGSLAHSKEFVERLRQRTSFIAPFFLYPGENEMEAMRDGTLRYLRGEEAPAPFPPPA